MLDRSQPLSSKTVERLIAHGKIELPGDDEPIIESQRMGSMFDDMDYTATVFDRIRWFCGIV
jgi:hypothetical protein